MFSIRPRTGTFIMFAIFTAFSTIIPTNSCGVATTTIPSNGIDWKTVNGTSPVPGGISTNITSMSFHNVLPQNCFTTSATTGPLQITGCVSSSNIKFKDTTSIPKFVIAGRMIPSAFPNNLS